MVVQRDDCRNDPLRLDQLTANQPSTLYTDSSYLLSTPRLLAADSRRYTQLSHFSAQPPEISKPPAVDFVQQSAAVPLRRLPNELGHGLKPIRRATNLALGTLSGFKKCLSKWGFESSPKPSSAQPLSHTPLSTRSHGHGLDSIFSCPLLIMSRIILKELRVTRYSVRKWSLVYAFPPKFGSQQTR